MKKTDFKGKAKDDSDGLSVRPSYLNQYIGQNKLKNNLKIFIGAALKREETLDHVLLYGPPGLGKTTLAYIISNEMKTNIKYASGPSFEKVGDLAALLASIEPGDIVFIDEIHRIPRIVEEALYSVMEDFIFHIIINKDVSSESIEIKIPPFTLVGATTRVGDLSEPLRARFGFCEKLEFYSIDELSQIILRTAKVLHTQIDLDGANEIAKRSRGTPRIANKIFKRVRDFANYENKNEITLEDTIKALEALKIDEFGLNDVDIKYLETLIKRYKGGPVGLETLSDSIGEESTNLEDVYEPYLLRIGFIERTKMGRTATKKAYKHLKYY